MTVAAPTKGTCLAALLTEEGSVVADGFFSSWGPFSLSSCSHSA